MFTWIQDIGVSQRRKGLRLANSDSFRGLATGVTAFLIFLASSQNFCFGAESHRLEGYGKGLGSVLTKGSTSCALSDRQASNVGVWQRSNSGSIQAQYEYDPYGVQTRTSGSGPEPDFAFGGMYVHKRSGMSVTPKRFYSAKLGRWVSRDPIEEGGGVNLYGYARNNPVNFSDPSGTSVCKYHGGGQSNNDPPPTPPPPPPPPVAVLAQDAAPATTSADAATSDADSDADTSSSAPTAVPVTAAAAATTTTSGGFELFKKIQKLQEKTEADMWRRLAEELEREKEQMKRAADAIRRALEDLGKGDK